MADSPARGQRRAVRIGKYEVVAHIAAGGMGAVYRARDTENQRDVALKVLPPEMAAKPVMLERFRREARAALKLRHENIVTLYEFGEAGGTCFLAMEFIDGIDLHEYIRRKGPLDPGEARLIVTQACRALAHAHEQGIVHRDIKPSNFLITRPKGRMVVKLTDMGLAREADAEEFRVTRAGTTVGTIDYMSPEQARDSGTADIRSDLYSLGCTWYHLLAGQVPFPSGGLGERLYKIMNEEPPDVRQFNPRVSNETAEVLERLLAKNAADRYQTPAELLDDLTALESGGPLSSRQFSLADLARAENESPRPRPARKTPRPKARRRPRSSATRAAAETAEEPLTKETSPARRGTWVLAGGAAALLVAGIILLLVVLRGRHGHAPEPQQALNPSPGTAAPPVAVVSPAPQRGPAPARSAGTELVTRPVLPSAPVKSRWRRLYEPVLPIEADKLRQEVEAPWARPSATAGQLVVLHVGRGANGAAGPSYPSLAEACAAAPPGKTTVLQLDDNGPFFQTPAAVAGRSLILRAGPGYRPLLVWDVQRTLDERRSSRDAAAAGRPLVFLEVRHGSLTLEGVDVALKCPDADAESLTLLQVEDGDLAVSACTFSAAGKSPAGVTLARFRGAGPEARRCRFTRCHARGASLSALDLDAPAAEVLFDGCLVVGGELPLLRVRADDKRGVTLRAVASTLIGGQTLLRVEPAKATDHEPALHWLGWDSLLSRTSGRAGGELLLVAGKEVGTRNMTWRAYNCLYAGWQNLLAGTDTISVRDIDAWQRRWTRTEGDVALSQPWPAAVFNDPAEISAATYRTAETPVGFAASAARDRPLGCDLDALPPAPEDWLRRTYERFGTPLLGSLADADPPEIPNPGDGLYHGERLDVGQIDLGAHLRRVQRQIRFGPRVVLHLTGEGERPMSPVRIKGSSLVLYFEPPAKDDAKPLRLTLADRSSAAAGALIEVDGGGLDVIGGELALTDSPFARVPPFLLRVRGGDLRLYRCRLEGPLQATDPHTGLIDLEGSGEIAADRARVCTLNESVLLSSRTALQLRGVGARLHARQSLIVAGREALRLTPGPACKDRANLQCLLEQVTVAAKEAVVRLDDTPYPGAPREPVVVQTRACAFLNPFPVRPVPSRPGLLLYEDRALSHGLLLWQSDNDAFDRRLYFGAAAALRPLPPKAEGVGSWVRLWGSPGVRRPVLDLNLRSTLDAVRGGLERLALPPGRGADLNRLGIKKKKPV